MTKDNRLRNGIHPITIVISGPSGVGKDTIISRLRETEINCHFAITATTRKQRSEEIHGKHYFFYTKRIFTRMINNGDFIEWAEVYGNLYGVPKRELIEGHASGIDVIVKTDVQGAMTIKEKMADVLLIFLQPPTIDSLIDRLSGRMTESTKDRALRLHTARNEIEQSLHFDYVVTNYDGEIDRTVGEIANIINTRRTI